MSEFLAPVDVLLYKGRSAVAEGDVFSILAHSPYVVRAFEFGLADGAVDCTHSYDVEASYAYRLWKLDQGCRMPKTTSNILLFDVKSAVVEQCYIATDAQRKHVAFYIGICAADPTFVELIPNYGQGCNLDQPGLTTAKEVEERYLSVNVDRHCRLPLRSYGINQTNSPYRMPISLLNEAIARVRLCAQGQGVYVNPWTLVDFPNWNPMTTDDPRSLKPAARTANFTAYDAALNIYQVVMSYSGQTSMTLDYVGLQPRLADFKLLLLDPFKQTRQVYIQHKIDPRLRAKSDSLSKVTVVARRRGKKRGYYFSALNRFDFLFFQFTFTNPQDPSRHTEFLFLPEYIIPDSFYTSLESELSFDRPEFQPYRISMNEDEEWVTRMHQIVQQEDPPRKPGQRPLRSDVSTMNKEQDDETWDEAEVNGPQSDTEDRGHVESVKKGMTDDGVSTVTQAGQPESSSSGVLPVSRAGYGDFTVLMEHGQVRFFNELMRQCAERRSGLVVVFSGNHPVCDFGYCRYAWTEHESGMYLRYGRTPRAAHHLPPYTPIIPICCYTRHTCCTFEGPTISHVQFRRLDSVAIPRLIVYDILGQDAHGQPLPLVIVPSEDIGVTAAQHKTFADRAQEEGRVGYTPTLSALLNLGYYAGEYGVGTAGPLVYDDNLWNTVWGSLDSFTLLQPVKLPSGPPREPQLYRTELRVLHERLAQEYYHATRKDVHD